MPADASVPVDATIDVRIVDASPHDVSAPDASDASPRFDAGPDAGELAPCIGISTILYGNTVGYSNMKDGPHQTIVPSVDWKNMFLSDTFFQLGVAANTD